MTSFLTMLIEYSNPRASIIEYEIIETYLKQQAGKLIEMQASEAPLE